ncbi:MAG: hypothetical protein AABZ47_12225 [Planctomycetota bacterium]
MKKNIVCYTFSPSVRFRDAEDTLMLSVMAVESLFGDARVRLDASYRLDPLRSITVDGGTEVGSAVVKVFTRLLTREFGEDSFRVRRAEAVAARNAEGCGV